jgi:hypothetical protein
MWTLLFGGPDWMPITPKTGSFLHADSHLPSAGIFGRQVMSREIEELAKRDAGWPYLGQDGVATAQPGTDCQIKFQLIHLTAGVRPVEHDRRPGA